MLRTPLGVGKFSADMMISVDNNSNGGFFMSESADDRTAFEEKAQERVLDAIDGRQVADFSSLPKAERRLSAAFLQRLISGLHETHGELCCPLRIRGADVTGPLLPPTATLQFGRAAVQFRECNFDSPVDLSGARFLVLRFMDCVLPAFIGASLHVSADLDLSGSRISGVSDYESELSHVGSVAIHLNNARIGGKLDLSSTDRSRFTAAGTIRLDGAQIDGSICLAGALLDGHGAPALSARSVTVGSNVELEPAAGHRCEINGEVVLVAAQVTGDLVCSGTRLSNPDGRALHCEDMKVESVFLSSNDEDNLPFEARGRLNFLTAIIGGSFFMSNARLAPGPDYKGLLKKGGPIVINLQQARISNALALRNIGALGDEPGENLLDSKATPVRGWFLLTGTQVNAILDDVKTGWPAAGFLDIEGATYTSIRHLDGGDVTSKRIVWLRRQFPEGIPDPSSFRPQPYEQLTRTLRQDGLAREANAIAVEKIRMRLAARVDPQWARIFPKLLMLISQHGYSTGRAMMSFLIFVLFGAAMYATALFIFQQPFLPIENPPEPVNYEFAFGLAQLATERGCPGLDVLHFALDAAMPVIDLGQDLRCRFTPEGPGRGFWLFLHSAYVIIGAALSAVVVLTLTGVLRQD
ncbi:MAG: hypothetical protein ACI8TX_004013 [Hyphomicrobiaceae bacterium]